MTAYRFVITSPGATATEGFSGVDERECSSIGAALTAWLAEILDSPEHEHRLELADFTVVATYTPPCAG